MYYLLLVVHILVSLFLVVVVLLQSGKAADLAAAFGGFGSQTVFGPRGSATVLTRATTISAILFMLTSLGLSVMSQGTTAAPTILDEITAPAGTQSTAPAPAPATPDASKQVQVEVQGGIEGGAKQTQTVPVTPKQ